MARKEFFKILVCLPYLAKVTVKDQETTMSISDWIALLTEITEEVTDFAD